jgi:hypothetical protein
MPKQGHITPSKFACIMAPKGIGQVALTYADEIVMGILGVQMPEISASALDWGLDNEPLARARYELENFCTVPEVTEPTHHHEYDFICGTPDGFIENFNTGQRGILEIKCPKNPQNHMHNRKFDTCQYHKLYKWQIQGYMWINRCEFAEFMSFDPRWPYDLQAATHHIEYDKAAVEELESRLLEFWGIVQDKLSDHI